MTRFIRRLDGNIEKFTIFSLFKNPYSLTTNSTYLMSEAFRVLPTPRKLLEAIISVAATANSSSAAVGRNLEIGTSCFLSFFFRK